MSPTSQVRQPLSLVSAVLVCIASVVSAQTNAQQSTGIPTVILPYFGPTAGKVSDEQGHPVAGAVVFCRSWPFGDPVGGYDRTTTGEDGTFSFCEPGVSYADYVTVAHPDFAYGENDINQTDSFRKNLTVTLGKGISVKGRIVDSKDRGIPGIEVSVVWENFYSQADKFVHAFALTDDNGDFEIQNAPDKPQLYLVARKFGEVAQSIGWYSAAAEMPPQRVMPEGYSIVTGPIAVRDGFTWKVPGRFRLAINAVDAESGEAVALNTIDINQNYIPFYGGGFYVQPVPPESALKVVVSNLGYFPYSIACAAAPDSQYLRGIVDGSFKKGFEGIEATKTVRFEKGIKVQGSVVDKLTGEVIPRARIQYTVDPSQAALLESKGINPGITASTNEFGKFDILVPSGPGSLQVAREISGYYTADPESGERVSLPIEPQPGVTPPQIEFGLERAPLVHGSAVDPSGHPVPGVSWIATEKEYHVRKLGGLADEHGNFLIESLYNDPKAKTGSASRVYCWDVDRDLCGWALAERGDAESGKRLDVELRPAQSLQGRVIDQTSTAGIPDLVVTVRMGAFTWTTKSDDKGDFKVTGLFPDLSYRLTVDHPDYQSSDTEFKTIDDSEPVSLEPIICKTAMSKSFEVVDVTELPDDVALERLVKYVREQIEQAPPEREQRFNDPIYTFRYKLAKAIDEQVSLLAARHPDSDFQCKVYLESLAVICTGQVKGMVSIPMGAEWTEQARLGLIRNIDRDGVFDAYRSRNNDWRTQSTIYPLTILKHSKKPEIRVWAHEEVFRDTLSHLGLSLNPKFHKIDEFESLLKNVKRLYFDGVTESGEVSPGSPAGTVLMDKFQETLTRSLKQIQRKKDYDPARVERFMEFIKELALEVQ